MYGTAPWHYQKRKKYYRRRGFSMEKLCLVEALHKLHRGEPWESGGKPDVGHRMEMSPVVKTGKAGSQQEWGSLLRQERGEDHLAVNEHCSHGSDVRHMH